MHASDRLQADGQTDKTELIARPHAARKKIIWPLLTIYGWTTVIYVAISTVLTCSFT